MVEPPAAKVRSPHGLRGDYSRAASDYTVAQDWEHYSAEDHALWSTLYRRQLALVERYAASGWRIVAVPGLVPDGSSSIIWPHGVSR